MLIHPQQMNGFPVATPDGGCTLPTGWVQDYGWSPLCFGLTSRNGTATAPLQALTKMFMLPGLELSHLRPLRRAKLTPAPDTDTVIAGAVSRQGGAAVLWVAHAPSDGLGELHRTFEVSGLPSPHVSSTACFPNHRDCTVTELETGCVEVSLQPNAILAVTFGGSQ